MRKQKDVLFYSIPFAELQMYVFVLISTFVFVSIATLMMSLLFGRTIHTFVTYIHQVSDFFFWLSIHLFVPKINVETKTNRQFECVHQPFRLNTSTEFDTLYEKNEKESTTKRKKEKNKQNKSKQQPSTNSNSTKCANRDK